MIVLRTARKKFVESEFAEAFQRIVQTEAFEEACHAALLTMVEEIAPHTTSLMASDAAVRLDGAKRLIEILETIWQKQEEPKSVNKRSLNYEAGI